MSRDAHERALQARLSPTGKVLLMPPEENAVLICVATGTGIAPYRAFWRRCFYENVPNYKFNGLFWLFMGVANSDAKLYDNEIQEMAVSVRFKKLSCTLFGMHLQRSSRLPLQLQFLPSCAEEN
eukprot:scaffold188189_cov18-Tisochrysis_lutea.AAC.2